jgi:TolB protein
MPGLDERLRSELRRAARPVSPDVARTLDHVITRRRRRRTLHVAGRSALALVVVLGSVGGVLALERAFRAPSLSVGMPSPVPIVPHENGRIAYGDGSSILTISPDGTHEQSIPLPIDGGWHPSWSPDGTKLAVTIFPAKGERQIWTMNADGSNAIDVAHAPNVSRASWSADGAWLAYTAAAAGGSTIHLVRPDGSDDHVVRNEIVHRDYFSAVFSPDDARIVYDAGTDVGFAIFVMDVDGTHVRQLTTGRQDYNPSWSPDGTKILFTRQEGPMESDIFVMNADGSNAVRLTSGGAGDTNLDGVFSPDGTKIAYIAGVTGGGGSIVVMNADGSNPAVVAQVDALGLDWQPISTGSAPSVRPEPTTSHDRGRDIGLDFRVCFSSWLGGIDFTGDGTAGSAWAAVPVKDDGICPEHPSPSKYLLAVDTTGDRLADSWLELPFRCDVSCAPFDATDLDGDGSEELVVASYFSIMDYHLFSVRQNPSRDPQVQPILVADPGHEPAGITPGLPLRIDAGGDEGYGSSIRCEGYPSAPVIIWSWSSGPVEGNAPTEVHVTRIQLQADGLFHVIGTNDYTVPARAPTGIDHETHPACGVDWHPSA